MADAGCQSKSATTPGEEQDESVNDPNPLEDVDAFEDVLEEELDNEKLAAGIDSREHIVGRVYEARASAMINTHTYSDGTKEINESDVANPSWEDQGYYQCHSCKMRIENQVVAFLHASERAQEFVQHLPPAIRADVSEIADLTEFPVEEAE